MTSGLLALTKMKHFAWTLFHQQGESCLVYFFVCFCFRLGKLRTRSGCDRHAQVDIHTHIYIYVCELICDLSLSAWKIITGLLKMHFVQDWPISMRLRNENQGFCFLNVTWILFLICSQHLWVIISGIGRWKCFRCCSWPIGCPWHVWGVLSGYTSTDLSCQPSKRGALGEQGHLTLFSSVQPECL